MKSQSDHIQELALRISQGDEKALTALYRLTYPILYRYGIRIIDTHQTEVVEEVVSEFFLWLAKNYQKVGKVTNFEAYMYRAIRQNINQTLIAKQKKVKTQQRFQERTAPLKENNAPSPEQILIGQEKQQETQDQIKNAINQLPIYQREALHLRFYEEREYSEIAQMLETNPQVVRNYVSRAIKGLRKHLGNLNAIFL